MTVHFFTSFSYSYLNRARVLFSSIRNHHPDWVCWAVLTDKCPPNFELKIHEEQFDHVIYADQLFGEGTDSWLFGHNIVEACTAVKGRSLQYLLSLPDCEKVVYLDPDIAVFNTLDPIIDLLDSYSIVLTPHQVSPDDKADKRAIRDNEITSLGYGVYNLGFIAVSNCDEGRRFATWWGDRLQDWCHDRLDIGVFVDQKWCDLVPCFFDGVKILRDPGYNVASWNLSQRKMSFGTDGEALINGSPLRFFHFTKLGPVGDMMTIRYAGSNVEVYELWAWYRQQVSRFTSEKIPERWWIYSTFDNGVKIPQEARVLYREREDLRAAFKEPFHVSDGFFDWLVNEGVVDAAESQIGQLK